MSRVMLSDIMETWSQSQRYWRIVVLLFWWWANRLISDFGDKKAMVHKKLHHTSGANDKSMLYLLQTQELRYGDNRFLPVSRRKASAVKCRVVDGVNKNEVVGPTRLARIRQEKSELAYLKLGKSCCDVAVLCPHHLTLSTDFYLTSHNCRIFLLHHHHPKPIQVSIVNRLGQVLDKSSSIPRRPLHKLSSCPSKTAPSTRLVRSIRRSVVRRPRLTTSYCTDAAPRSNTTMSNGIC